MKKTKYKDIQKIIKKCTYRKIKIKSLPCYKCPLKCPYDFDIKY